ncbi:MAG: TIGR03085 family metal-binding protein [Acidothermaceae bacterium]
MNLASSERRAICDLLDELGPDEPTLCEGWNTADLAAHLVLREGRLDAMPGIALKFLAGHTAKVQKTLARKDFGQLVDRLRTGPPRFSPFRPARLDEAANGIEFVVHHEDIRRAQPSWQPRTFDRHAEDLFFKRLRFATKSALRNKRFGVDVVRSDTGDRMNVHVPPASATSAGPTVTVTGLPSELLIYFSRQGHAAVETDGDIF